MCFLGESPKTPLLPRALRGDSTGDGWWNGFGLHSGANAAQQMGGALWAESEGPGHGATFTLELPLKTCPPALPV
jgi:signal transduction histidine kinase